MKYTYFIVFLGIVAAEVPLYIPADLPCSDLWSHHIELGASGGGESIPWEEEGEMCNITFRAVAVSTPEGRTTVSYDTTFQVRKELLSQVLNTVLRVRERESRQVGDPFVSPYLAGVYQRLGLEYSSLLCFTRVTLLWRRIAAARAAAATTATVTTPISTSTSMSAPDLAKAAGTTAAESNGASVSPPPPPSRFVARVVSLDWHVQQLHRELILEPWKAADLRLMLSRAAAFAEVHLSAKKPSVAASAAGCSTAAAASGIGSISISNLAGPWLPRHASARLRSGTATATADSSSSSSSSGSLKDSAACSKGVSPTGLLSPRGHLDAAYFWVMWLMCPTMLVALEAMQAAPDNPWMALYICIIATCRTIAEWRTTLSVTRAPGLTPAQRLYGMAAAHLASGGASAVVTGLLNTWLPLLGHGAASAVVWLHLLLLPAVMVAGMSVAGMPVVARQLADGGGNGGGTGGATRRNTARDRRHAGGGGGAAATDPLDLIALGRRSNHEFDRGGRSGSGGGGGDNGRGGVMSLSAAAAAAAAAQVHWPPALEVPAWLDDWPNAPEAFRCPITQSLMREPAQASSGVTYERPAIMQWLDHRRVDPVTHVPLKRHRLAPNLNLRHMIEVWVQDRVEARRRLAQRLREEISAEVATLAAVTAKAAEEGEEAETAADGSASSSGGEMAEMSSESVVVGLTSHQEQAAAANASNASNAANASNASNAANAANASNAANAANAANANAASTSAANASAESANGALPDGENIVAGSAVVTAAPAVGVAAGATTLAANSDAPDTASGEQAGLTTPLLESPTAAGDALPCGDLRGDGGEPNDPKLSELHDGDSGGEAAVRVAEVEALAVAAARARTGCQRRTRRCRNAPGPAAAVAATAVASGGGGGGDNSQGTPAAYRDADGDADADAGGDADADGDCDTGATSAGSGESLFTTVPGVLRNSRVGEEDAETTMHESVLHGAERSGGIWSHLYDRGSLANHRDYGLAGEAGIYPAVRTAATAGAAANSMGCRRRRRQQRGLLESTGIGVAAAAAATATGADGSSSASGHRRVSHVPSWDMEWDGAYPDSSGELAAYGSDTNIVTVAAIADAFADASGTRDDSGGAHQRQPL